MILDGKEIVIEKDGKIRDSQSQSVLYKHYAPYLYGMALRYTRSEEEAQDLLQDIFLTIFDNFGQYSGKGPIRAWMTRIVINRALSLRDNSKHALFDNYDNQIEEIADNSIIESDMFAHEILLGFIRDLPKGYQIAFNLCGIEGYSYNEVAKILKCSVSTCRTQFFKARNALRKRINDFNEKEKENLVYNEKI
ncbi:MAG: RNA polymerase sigma factor [Bacteroidales bacterium]|jgi:RNA polymerase sigma-70 factor (ECF subfamily)|nr:RNA polymerase sigma factor [Bacteroidales bacterium]